MSETSKRNHDQDHERPSRGTAQVDWAEKLKASMNEGPRDEVAASASPAFAEEDDLAALLRAQLAKQTPIAAMSLDTSEFEDDEPEIEDDEPEIEDDEPEIEDDEPEIEDDEPEIEDDEPEIEDDEPEFEDDEPEIEDDEPEIEDDEPEIKDDEPEIEDDEPEIEDDEPEIEDDEPEIEDDEPEIEDDEPEIEDDEPEFEDDEPEIEDDEPDIEEEELPVAAEFTWEEAPAVTTDDQLNGLPLRTAIAALRQQLPEEEAPSFVQETMTFDDLLASEPPDEAESAIEPTVGESVVDASTVSESPRSLRTESIPMRSFADDPLQIGLDSPSQRPACLTGSSFAKDDSSPAETVAPADAPVGDYTDRMPRMGGEEERERDTDLYLQLGYGDHLRRPVEQTRVERVRTEQAVRKAVKPRNEPVAAFRGKEYTHRGQTDAIEAAYARARGQQLARLLIALTGALVALLYDCWPLAADHLGLPLPAPRLYAWIAFAWLLLISAPFLSRLGRGLRSLWEFQPTRYATAALGLVITALYALLCALTASEESVSLLSGAALLMLGIAALGEFVNTAGEYAAFSVVASGKPVYTLTDEETPAAICGGASSEPALTAVRAGRVADYFARTARYNPYMSRLNYLLPVALLAAILCAGLAMARGASFPAEATQVFAATYLACLPAAYLLAMSLPLCRANRLVAQKGCAVIGAAAPADYAAGRHTRLLFADGDALGALHRKEITLRDDPQTETWRQMAAHVFRLLGGPLAADVPANGADADAIYAEIAEVEEHYIRLYLIDERVGRRAATEVMLGTHEALVRRGVRLPKAGMEQSYKKSEDSRVVYLAFDRRFRLAYAVEYRAGRTFVRTARRLAKLGHAISLYTYDPLVTADLLDIPPLQRLPRVEIRRPDCLETLRTARSAGVVATGRSLDLLHPYAACHRMKRAYRLAHVGAWLCLLGGFALSVLAVLYDGGRILSSATVAAGQLLSAALMAAVGWLTFDRRSLFLKQPKETRPAAPNRERSLRKSKK